MIEFAPQIYALMFPTLAKKVGRYKSPTVLLKSFFFKKITINPVMVELLWVKMTSFFPLIKKKKLVLFSLLQWNKLLTGSLSGDVKSDSEGGFSPLPSSIFREDVGRQIQTLKTFVLVPHLSLTSTTTTLTVRESSSLVTYFSYYLLGTGQNVGNPDLAKPLVAVHDGGKRITALCSLGSCGCQSVA